MNRDLFSICMDKTSMRKVLEIIGGDLRPFENTTTWLYRVADDVGVSFRVIKAVWYGERVSPETALKLKQAVKRNERPNKRIAERLEWSAALLREKDEEFFRDEIAYYRELASVVRDFDGEKKQKMTKPLTKKRAIELMRNQQSVLVKMHTTVSTEGFAWYVVPGGSVTQEVAIALLARPDIKPGNDGLWPGHEQTWRMI